eukprot:6062872-Amphidinium_carterae.1
MQESKGTRVGLLVNKWGGTAKLGSTSWLQQGKKLRAFAVFAMSFAQVGEASKKRRHEFCLTYFLSLVASTHVLLCSLGME